MALIVAFTLHHSPIGMFYGGVLASRKLHGNQGWRRSCSASTLGTNLTLCSHPMQLGWMLDDLACILSPCCFFLVLLLLHEPFINMI